MPDLLADRSSDNDSLASMELFADRGIPALCYCGEDAVVISLPVGNPCIKYFGCPMREFGSCDMKKCLDEALIEEIADLTNELDDLRDHVQDTRSQLQSMLGLLAQGGQDYNELNSKVMELQHFPGVVVQGSQFGHFRRSPYEKEMIVVFLAGASLAFLMIIALIIPAK